MVNVIFCGFGEGMDKRVFAKKSDLLLRVAKQNGVKIPSKCEDGTCGSCAVIIEELNDNTSLKPNEEGYNPEATPVYMEDKELNTLIKMGAISKKEADIAQQYDRQTPVRLACQCIIRTDIIVKPYK